MSDNGYHDKIRKVLAMLEGAKTPGEAQAASLALQRLMARSGLTAEQVDALGAENVQFPVTQDGVYIGTNDVAWKKMLAAVIGENFRCLLLASPSPPAMESSASGSKKTLRRPSHSEFLLYSVSFAMQIASFTAYAFSCQDSCNGTNSRCMSPLFLPKILSEHLRAYRSALAAVQ